MLVTRLLTSLALAQLALGARVVWRFAATAGGHRVRPSTQAPAASDGVSVIVPVLNEERRLAPCLAGLVAQGPEVGEILVVDGGSTDGTRELVAGYQARDARVRLIDASPVPSDWNGKIWGLQVGLEQGRPDTSWVLTVDADVRPAPLLVRSLLAHAHQEGVGALSVATLQEVAGPGVALVHPALLATLVYRFGMPGRVPRRVRAVQANGQCFLARRGMLRRTEAFRRARASTCEDITIARCLVAAGYSVGFYEAGELVAAEMYQSWRETWRNWPRSLPLRDHYVRAASLVGLAEVTLAQALPLPLLVGLCAWLIAGRPAERAGLRWLLATSGALALVRLGVLCGTARAYRRRPSTYWLSPLCDVPVAVALWRSTLRRRHVWRGRVLVREGGR